LSCFRSSDGDKVPDHAGDVAADAGELGENVDEESRRRVLCNTGDTRPAGGAAAGAAAFKPPGPPGRPGEK
jgi:hypothetical protein